MQTNPPTWKGPALGVAALPLMAACGLRAVADPPPAKNALPRPLPQDLVAAWKKAGATVGWMRLAKSGYLLFLPEDQRAVGDLPAFRFPSWKESLLARRPAPAEAFGVYLRGMPVPDAGLKELRKALPGCSIIC